jgi:rubrerythrin
MRIPIAHRAWESDEDRNHRAGQNHDTAGWMPDEYVTCPGCGTVTDTVESDTCPRCDTLLLPDEVIAQTWPR